MSRWVADSYMEEVYVQDNDFTHDGRLHISGDFEDLRAKIKYAEMIADRLNKYDLMRDYAIQMYRDL